MRFLKDNEKTRSVIIDFLKEKNRTVRAIRFQEDCAFVTARDDEMMDLFKKYVSAPGVSQEAKRTVLLVDYLSSKFDSYSAMDQMFLVNDFECVSFLDLDEKSSCDFSKDWRYTMYKSLSEGADDYLCEAEDFVNEIEKNK